MDKNPLVRKSLVVSVILLYLGVAVIPSINFTLAKSSNNSDIVEVNIQVCDINEFQNTTVKLTRKQYKSLQQYFVNFRLQLNQTTTRKKTVSIFKEAVVELNNYGLLPKGLNVSQAQKLVITGYLYEKVINFFHNIIKKNQWVSSDNINNLCLVAGVTNQTVFTGIAFTTLYSAAFITALLWGLFDEFGLHLIENILNSLGLLFLFSTNVLFLLSSKLGNLIPIGGFTMFGKRISSGYGHHIYYPSEGWIWTKGLNGEKKWSGSFVGDVYFYNLVRAAGVEKYYIGAIGFTGFTIKRILNGETIFLGNALRAAFVTEPPYP